LAGRIAQDRGKVIETAGELRDASGQVFARGTAKYMPVPPEQIAALCSDFLPDPQTIPLEEIVGGKSEIRNPKHETSSKSE
jgi:hypothetical protein